MGKCRFLYNNLITSESMLTISSLRPGLVSSALKEGLGSATMQTIGPFSGAVDLEYVVEIDSVAGGAEIGQATFRWSDGSGGWNATGVLTSSVYVTLNNAVQIKWTAGSGDDFVIADKWYFKALNLFNPGKMLDSDRDSRHRSAVLESPNTIIADLGSPQEIKALALWDHNLTAGATITLDADAAATFDSGAGGTPEFTEIVTWAADYIAQYLTTPWTRRYWRLNITDAANPDGFIEAGELFLGSYLELSKEHEQGAEMPIEMVLNKVFTSFGVKKTKFYNQAEKINIKLPFIPEADVDALEAMLASLGNKDTGLLKPLWWTEDSAYPQKTWLVEIEGMGKSRAKGSNTLWNISLEMEKVLKTL